MWAVGLCNENGVCNFHTVWYNVMDYRTTKPYLSKLCIQIPMKEKLFIRSTFSIFIATLSHRTSKLILKTKWTVKSFLYCGCLMYAIILISISWMSTLSGSGICLRHLWLNCAKKFFGSSHIPQNYFAWSYYNLNMPCFGYKESMIVRINRKFTVNSIYNC